MAKIVILYVTELGCNHTHLALSDYGGDRGLHTEGFFIGILCLNAVHRLLTTKQYCCYLQVALWLSQIQNFLRHQNFPHFCHPHQLRQDKALYFFSSFLAFFDERAIDARFDDLTIIRASINCTGEHDPFQLLSFCDYRSPEGNEGIMS